LEDNHVGQKPIDGDGNKRTGVLLRLDKGYGIIWCPEEERAYLLTRSSLVNCLASKAVGNTLTFDAAVGVEDDDTSRRGTKEQHLHQLPLAANAELVYSSTGGHSYCKCTVEATQALTRDGFVDSSTSGDSVACLTARGEWCMSVSNVVRRPNCGLYTSSNRIRRNGSQMGSGWTWRIILTRRTC
jgi:hypothetical protein